MNLYGIVSALRTTRKQMESAAESGANAHTNGFRQRLAVAKTAGYVSEGSELKATNGVAATNARQYVRGTKISETYESDQQAELKDTGKSTQVAIDGEGYFAVASINPAVNIDNMHTVAPNGANGVRWTAHNLAAEYTRLGAKIVDDHNTNFGDADFAKDNFGVSANGGDVVVAPVNVIPLHQQVEDGTNFGQNAPAAPLNISGEGLNVDYTRVGDMHWDSIKITNAGGAVTHTDNRLVTSNGMFAVGWVNINANHPTNKKPQWVNGHADVGNILDKTQNNNWMAHNEAVFALGADYAPNDVAHAAQGLVAIPCTANNACVIRVQNLKDYADVRINGNGEIIGVKNGETVILAKLANVRFDSPDSLVNGSNGLLIASQAAGEPKYGTAGESGAGRFEAGMLEGSNVDLSECSIELAKSKAVHVFANNALNTSLQVEESDANIVRGV
ncbi:MAG: hypothetical protein II453_10240 [Alphaproteobacteria bacterium]|nr:hypothetical protein [Alphaproteobacteria bacterium]